MESLAGLSHQEIAMFNPVESEYIHSQPLARLGTVSPKGQVDVVPVGFEFDGQVFYVSGRDLPATLKYKNIQRGNTLVGLAIDDLPSIRPWRARGIKIHARADIVERDGMFGRKEYIRLTPLKSWSWGLENEVFAAGQFNVRKVQHNPTSTTNP
jgi:pyridoxamine 5'-phosphate oxidase family protein